MTATAVHPLRMLPPRDCPAEDSLLAFASGDSDAAAPWQFRLDPALSVLPRNARTREIQGECHDR